MADVAARSMRPLHRVSAELRSGLGRIGTWRVGASFGAVVALGIAAVLSLPAPASGQTEMAALTAQRGDGIWSLLERAGLPPTRGYIRAFKELNEERLIRGDRLLAGRTYELPEAPATGPGVTVVSLFGPRHERVARKSDRLAGHVYYIVGGHGGPDPGAIGRYGGRALPEDEVAYDVALRLARRLIEEGATVHLIVQDPDDGIRDGSRFGVDRDERYLGGVRISTRQARRLQDRVAIINRLYDEHRPTARLQRVLTLHVDARGKRHEPQLDVHFQVASSRSRRFAETLLATFRDQYRRVQPGRGYDGTVEFRNLYVLRHTKPVAALVELGNIRHPRDQVRLTRASNRQALAEWLTRGLLREAGR